LERISPFLGCYEIPTLKELCFKLISTTPQYGWHLHSLPQDLSKDLKQWQINNPVNTAPTLKLKSFLHRLYTYFDKMKAKSASDIATWLYNETKEEKLLLTTEPERGLFCDVFVYIVFKIYQYTKWFPDVARTAEYLQETLKNYSKQRYYDSELEAEITPEQEEIDNLVRLGGCYPPFVAYLQLHIQCHADIPESLWEVWKKLPKKTTTEKEAFFVQATQDLKNHWANNLSNA